MKFGKRAEIQSIVLENVSLIEGAVTLFEKVSLEIQPNSNTWVFGEVTAGHLLKVMVGLKEPTSGRVLVNGQDIYEMDFEEYLPYRLNIAYSFSLGGILNNRTIKENLLLPFLYHGAPLAYAEREVREILEMFQLEKYQDLRPAAVPGIIRKLCCLTRAMVITPQVLVLDDPTSAMKPEMIARLRAWIDQRKTESPLAVIMATEHGELFKGWNYETFNFENGHVGVESASAQKVVGL